MNFQFKISIFDSIIHEKRFFEFSIRLFVLDLLYRSLLNRLHDFTINWLSRVKIKKNMVKSTKENKIFYLQKWKIEES